MHTSSSMKSESPQSEVPLPTNMAAPIDAASGRLVALVDLYWTRDKDPRVPLGHASLLAALHRAGITVRSIIRAVNATAVDPAELAREILWGTQGKRPDGVDVAIGAYVWAEDIIQRLLPELRRQGFRGRIILGGPQITYAGAGLERIYPDADVFVRGYGEEALVELARLAGRPHINGVHHAGEQDRVEQALVDFTKLASPWLDGAGHLAPQPFIRWETQRGCPFDCSFCQHREAGLLLQRELNRGRLLREIEFFCRTGVKDIAVLDPIFNAGKNATVILKAFLQHGYRGRLSLQCRAELITSEFLDVASQLDVRLEFGLQTIHEREACAVHRRNNLGKVDDVLAAVRARAIPHEVSLIFGLPEQTLASFLASVQWCLERRVPVIKAFPLMLLRGTQLEVERDRWALRENGAPMPIVVASNSFTEAEWAVMARVSDALSKTEGAHAEQVAELLRVAETCEPDLLRWLPVSLGGAR